MHTHHLPWCASKHNQPCNCEEWRYGLSALIAFGFGSIEYGVGVRIGSVAAQGDAFHLFADGFQSVVSLLIVLKAKGHAEEKRWRRYGAYMQASLLTVIAAVIAYQAVFHSAVPRSGIEMTVLGAAATAVALLRLWVVHPEWHHTITGRGEVRHVAIDVGTSGAVLVGGLCLWAFKIPAVDRIAAAIIAFFALMSARETWKDASSSKND